MPCDYSLLPHEGIRTLSPYIPGKSAESVAKEQGLSDIIKLASNENPLGCSPSVTKALQALTPKQIAAYPLASEHPLRQKLADQFGIEREMLIFGNGSDALFGLLITCFALHTQKHILTHNLAFSTFAIQAKTLGVPVVTTPVMKDWQIDIEAMIAACHENTALIFLANPNNPTGSFLPQALIQRLLDHIPPSTLLVLDEAYYEYVDESQRVSVLSLRNSYPNLVITRTFSKAYGLAGLRLGYAIASREIIQILQRALLPFSVNTAALVAANAAWDDHGFLTRSIQNTVGGMKQLQEGLTALGFDIRTTYGNFITFDCKKNSAPLYEHLQERGIIVRPLHPYGLNQYLRVTVGTSEQNKRFLTTFKEVLHDQSFKQPSL